MVGRLVAHLRGQWMGALALFLVLSGGSAYALAGHNSVLSDDIKNGQVKPQDLANPEKPKSAGLTNTQGAGCSQTPNQWAEQGAVGSVGYYRDADGAVHLTGVVADCDAPSSTIFTLPPGYRPERPKMGFAWADHDPTARTTNIGVDGDVSVGRQGLSEVYSLDGIEFRCGPAGKHGCP
jgi:hypothetical protein